MVYRCTRCGASGSPDTLAKNALRRAAWRSNDPDAEPWYETMLKREEPDDCEICECQPATSTGLCLSCMAKLRDARRAAHNLTDTEKRARARAAVEMLLERGYVAVRLCS